MTICFLRSTAGAERTAAITILAGLLALTVVACNSSSPSQPEQPPPTNPPAGPAPVTVGVWRGTGSLPDGSTYEVCFNVAADGRSMTSDGSPCGSISVKLQVAGSGGGCNINILVVEDFTFLGVGATWSYTGVEAGVTYGVGGIFDSPTTINGNATETILGKSCRGEWTATPEG